MGHGVNLYQPNMHLSNVESGLRPATCGLWHVECLSRNGINGVALHHSGAHQGRKTKNERGEPSSLITRHSSSQLLEPTAGRCGAALGANLSFVAAGVVGRDR